MPFCLIFVLEMGWHVFEWNICRYHFNKKIKTMKLVRYNNFEDYVPTSWNSLLDSFINDSTEKGSKETKFMPSADIIENEESFEVHVAVPGMKKDDFHLQIDDNSLVISGERKWKEEQKEKNFHRVETQFGSFKRSFSLPKNVNTEAISATYQDGILGIDIPKDKKKELTSTIKVK